MGAFGGFLSGMGQGIQNKQKQDSDNGKTGNSWGGLLPGNNGGGVAGGSGIPATTPATPSIAQPGGTPAQPQPQHKVFQGLLPMAQGYYANHQAKVQDAQAQPHISSLQDPTLTPEQQQYHLSNLQSIYAGRPEMLKQYGLQAPGAPTAAAPVVQAGGNQ